MKSILPSFALGVAMLCFSSISRVAAQNISTIAGTSVAGNTGDGGPATAAKIESPTSVILDNAGNVYFTSGETIRKINPAGIISTIAGTGVAGYSIDGGQATAAKLNNPMGMAMDKAGNIFFADRFNNRIRKITPAGIISTYIGDGSYTTTGDGGLATAATCGWPAAVAFDTSGNMYIADEGGERIRKINTAGIIETIAGSGTMGSGAFTGDGGPATAARFNAPVGVAVDQPGNVYISDYYNNRIRKISTAGIMSTYAGTGTGGYNTDGIVATGAELRGTWHVKVDDTGNLYIADQGNNRIRKVNTAGIISTLAGTGSATYTGDGGPATAATVKQPCDMAIDECGSIYIADWENNVIRKITMCVAPPSTVTYMGGQPVTFSLVPNPNNGSFTITGTAHDGVDVTITNVLGQIVYRNMVAPNNGTLHHNIILPAQLSNGLYIAHLNAASEKRAIRFVVSR